MFICARRQISDERMKLLSVQADDAWGHEGGIVDGQPNLWPGVVRGPSVAQPLPPDERPKLRHGRYHWSSARPRGGGIWIFPVRRFRELSAPAQNPTQRGANRPISRNAIGHHAVTVIVDILLGSDPMFVIIRGGSCLTGVRGSAGQMRRLSVIHRCAKPCGYPRGGTRACRPEESADAPRSS